MTWAKKCVMLTVFYTKEEVRTDVVITICANGTDSGADRVSAGKQFRTSGTF